MTKVIIFDLGGVLFTNGTKKFIDLMADKYKLEKEKIKTVMDGDLGTRYRQAEITRDEFWKTLLTELGLDADADELETRWIDGYEIIGGTRDLIQELSKKYKIYYLSDNVKERIDKINARHNFLRWFEGGVFSHEVGIRKPNPQIYHVALAKTGAKAEEAIFIDDKPHFLLPAKAMGMVTFAFTTPEKLREDLRKAHII